MQKIVSLMTWEIPIVKYDYEMKDFQEWFMERCFIVV